ncbi:MAG: hypothetical protein V1493_03955 [Candidatus Diapherotrites archaeon]
MKPKTLTAKIRENKLLIFIAIAIFCLVAASAILLVQAFGIPQKPFSAEKRLLESKHAELAGVFGQIEADFPGQALLDENSLEGDYTYYLYISLLGDVQFFKALELENYNAGMLAQSDEAAKAAFAREAAIDFSFQSALLLNTYPLADEYWDYFEDHYDEETGNAIQKLPQIKPEGFISSEISTELLAEAGIKKESIKAETAKIIAQYLELRKTAFEKALAEKDRLKAFMEANKIIGLYELCGGTV